MNLDSILLDFHTEITKLENEGRGGEALWCGQRIAVQGLMTYGLSLCSQTQEYEKAVEIFKFINKIDPGNWLAASNLTHAYSQLFKYDDAFEAVNQSIKFSKEENYDVFYNAGVVLTNLGRIADAEIMYRNAAKINPTKESILFNLGLNLLRQGKYEEGWNLYEYRFKVNPLTGSFKKRFLADEWDGRPFKKKSLLVYSEQGLGDFVMFSRFLQQTKKLGGKLIVEVQEPLFDIVKNNFDFVDEVIFRENSTNWPKPPLTDYAISVCSLPRIHKIDNIEKIQVKPYLKTNSKFKLNKNKKLKIGLCWCGNSDHSRDITRSAHIQDFKKLFDQKNVEIYSLVKGVKGIRNWIKGKIDLNEGKESLPLIDLESKFNNFEELGAIINSLDLVITVDTGLAHLCGAMGKPVWIMIGRDTDWRWADTVNTTPWYPSATLFRYKTSWSDLVDEVVNALPTNQKAK